MGFFHWIKKANKSRSQKRKEKREEKSAKKSKDKKSKQCCCSAQFAELKAQLDQLAKRHEALIHHTTRMEKCIFQMSEKLQNALSLQSHVHTVESVEKAMLSNGIQMQTALERAVTDAVNEAMQGLKNILEEGKKEAALRHLWNSIPAEPPRNTPHGPGYPQANTVAYSANSTTFQTCYRMPGVNNASPLLQTPPVNQHQHMPPMVNTPHFYHAPPSQYPPAFPATPQQQNQFRIPFVHHGKRSAFQKPSPRCEPPQSPASQEVGSSILADACRPGSMLQNAIDATFKYSDSYPLVDCRFVPIPSNQEEIAARGHTGNAIQPPQQ